ncbi:MAG: cation-translocating P-type ATPase, partial [Lachnospiraceae bacterium]|nr:cation-translocating P-type ATPase [Lachnospiraceae bacterium]
GSDAACQAAQLVLLENDFSRMTDVVMEGRQVVNNLERSGSLFLVKNLFSLLMAMFSIIFNIVYPLDPSQITLISTFTIGMPGFFLSQVPDHNRIEGRFLSNILLRALPAGLTDALIVGALVIFGKVFAVDHVDISTACTILLAIVGFMILFQISKPMNTYKWVIFGVSFVGLFFCAYALNDLFSITSMSKRCIMLFVVFSICTEPLFRYLTMLLRFCRSFCHDMKEKYWVHL